MRNLILKILSTMASFYVAQKLVAGFHLESTWQAYLISAIIFLLFNLLVGPLIKLLLLPINLLTLRRLLCRNLYIKLLLPRLEIQCSRVASR